jgi:hypothetical protein
MTCDAMCQHQPRSIDVSFFSDNPSTSIAYLVVGENESIRNNYVLPSPSNEHNNLGDVIRGQGVAATINQLSAQKPNPQEKGTTHV